ncbi:MAG: YHS domain-containing protein [Chloroflexi bacterium]|nr:MAG: YHS domain-containing protein [Chloroflexota bacterium]
MSTVRCAICGTPVADGALRVRYEDRIYTFDALKCKRIFQENPDRYLDATGGVLEEPR